MELFKGYRSFMGTNSSDNFFKVGSEAIKNIKCEIHIVEWGINEDATKEIILADREARMAIKRSWT